MKISEKPVYVIKFIFDDNTYMYYNKSSYPKLSSLNSDKASTFNSIEKAEKEVNKVLEKIEVLKKLGCKHKTYKIKIVTITQSFTDIKECKLKKKGKKNIDEECLSCRRYLSNTCDGVNDRKREDKDFDRCSGYLSSSTYLY